MLDDRCHVHMQMGKFHVQIFTVPRLTRLLTPLDLFSNLCTIISVGQRLAAESLHHNFVLTTAHPIQNFKLILILSHVIEIYMQEPE